MTRESPATDPARVCAFLIADVRGYTRFTDERGDEAAAALAEHFAALTKKVVNQGGGEMIELRGDEALAVFDSPRQVLRTAIDLQDRFRAEGEANDGYPLNVGIGIDAGEAVAVQGGYRTGALNLAARLCSLARPGEVFASQEVVHLARKVDGLVYLERGEVRLKGLDSPVAVIQVVREDAVPGELPKLSEDEGPRSNLPTPATPFVGRTADVEEVTHLIREEDINLLTLIGPGGTGKTRLALEVAGRLLSDFDDGAFFVDLVPLRDPELLPSAIASQLGVHETAHRSPIDSLREHLQDKRTLLVLDNFEHLLNATEVVSELITQLPDLKVLVTSRAALRISGEHEYSVPPLAVPDPEHLAGREALSKYDSVTLFVQRARAVRPDFTLNDENARFIAEICHRLDGLPLALELAAARTRLFQPQALLARLSSRLDLLTSGARDAPARQRTLRDTIDWSFSLLEEEEQLLFARLAVLAGSWTLEAAETICTPDAGLAVDVLDATSSLCEKSLLIPERADEPRFRMLETIREYAWERLVQRGEQEELRRRHAEHFFEMAQHVGLGRDLPSESMARLEQEHDNLVAAMEYWRETADMPMALKLGSHLQFFWTSHGYWTEERKWLDELLEHRDQLGTEDRIEALEAAAVIFTYGPDREQALELKRELANLKNSIGLLSGRADLLLIEAEQSTQVDTTDKMERLTEAMRLYREAGDWANAEFAQQALMEMAFDQGNVEEARAVAEEGLRLNREQANEHQIAVWMAYIGETELQKSDYDQAMSHFEESLALRRNLGDKRCMTHSLRGLGRVQLEQGEAEPARQHFEGALQLTRDIDDKPGEAWCTCLLGRLAYQQADSQSARSLYIEALRRSLQEPHPMVVAKALEWLADLEAEEGSAERAARMYGAAMAQSARVTRALLSPIRDVIPAPRIASEAALLRGLHATNPTDLAAAWREGQAMDLESAVSYASES